MATVGESKRGKKDLRLLGSDEEFHKKGLDHKIT